MELTKGHGTQNDFVLLFDPDGGIAVDPAAVRVLTDRRAGIGGDGLIRVIHPAGLAASPAQASDVQAAKGAGDDGAVWFMDYRNADGSIAEMCGNGVRVFAHYLVEHGLVDPSAGFAVGTRAGTKHVTVVDNPLDATPGAERWYRVDMGAYAFPLAPVDGMDSTVVTDGVQGTRPALSVDMGNPHTVLALAGVAELDRANLLEQPVIDPVPPAGTNVEYIVISGEPVDGVARLRMRVNERGVGETYACGTGACAAALAAHTWAGSGAPGSWYVEQPGGTVRIDIAAGTVALSGPAVLTAVLRPTRRLLREAGLEG